MKFALLTLSLLTFASCGNGKGNGTERKTSGTDQVTETEAAQEVIELTEKEAVLLKNIVEVSRWNQIELVTELALFSELSESTLKKLDQHITMRCESSDGSCTVTTKEVR